MRLIISILLIAATLRAEQLLVEPGREPVLIEARPGTAEAGSIIFEGYFADLPIHAPIYAVLKIYREGDWYPREKGILAVYHSIEHVREQKERYDDDPKVIMSTLHPDQRRQLQRLFPDREIFEVMPPMADTRILQKQYPARK
jgi:hypothetical protein